ncbi:MAG: hypothetical protein ABIR71_07625 [Chthoniobacterales bacterium]
MPTEEPPLSFEQPRSAFGTWLGVVLLFAVFALFVWAVLGMMPRGDRYEETRAAARMEKLKVVHDEAAALHTYGWVDKEKGVAHIPVDRAMQLSLAELAQKKPAPAGPIVAPAAAPAAGAAAAPAPVEQGGPQTTAPTVPAPVVSPSPAGTPAPADSHAGPGSAIGGQPAAAANPRDAAPATQPGANATPAASAPPPAAQAPLPPNERGPIPVQSPPGTPLPVRGATPGR